MSGGAKDEELVPLWSTSAARDLAALGVFISQDEVDELAPRWAAALLLNTFRSDEYRAFRLALRSREHRDAMLALIDVVTGSQGDLVGGASADIAAYLDSLEPGR